MPSPTEKRNINELKNIIASIERFKKDNEDNEESTPLSMHLIEEARKNLERALLDNQNDYADGLRAAREDRDLRRQENGYPE